MKRTQRRRRTGRDDFCELMLGRLLAAMEQSTLVMTPKHPKWKTFTTILAGPLGCRFQRGDPKNPKTALWRCSSGSDFKYARRAMRHFGKGVVDPELSIAYFRQRGGYCDCEVLLNVERSAERERARGKGARP